ncbi:unnamed protein product [Closterium sp. NIES-54]
MFLPLRILLPQSSAKPLSILAGIPPASLTSLSRRLPRFSINRIVGIALVAGSSRIRSTPPRQAAARHPAASHLFELPPVALDLSRNQLSGSIPATISALTQVSYLSLMSNQLTGSIPVEIGSLLSLASLQLYRNQLTGSIPAELGNMTNLVTLWLDTNQLNGPIPADIGMLTKLKRMSLRSNQLTGSIPSEIGYLPSMSIL